MGLKVTNNAYGTLNASITSSSTTIVLVAGQGSRFPTLSAGDYFYATLIDTSNNLEIVKVTARSTDTLTVVRGQDSTTARAYATNDRFELRPTAALFNEKADAADVSATYLPKAGGTMTGKLIVGDSTASTAATTLVNGSNLNGTSGRSHQVEFGFDGNQTYRHVIRTRHNSAAAANNAIDFRLWTPSEASDASLGSKTVLTLDGTGAITKAYQPSFKATSTDNNTSAPSPASDQGLLGTKFNKVTDYSNHNIGGHYNTSTGRFTAPVAGVYFVFANVRWETADFTQNSYIRLYVEVNGGGVGYRTGIHQINGTNEAWQNYMAMTISGTLLLSAGDYVELRGGMNGGTAVAYWGESGWGAYLLG